MLAAIWGEWQRAGLAVRPTKRGPVFMGAHPEDLDQPTEPTQTKGPDQKASQSHSDGYAFADYRLGGNNRRIIRLVIEDLEREYGVKVEFAFGPETLVRKGEDGVRRMYISEARLDSYLRGIELAQKLKARMRKREFNAERDLYPHWEAMGHFILAHEYFHLALMHLEVADGEHVDGFTSRVFGNKFQRLAELQANYLAADYLEHLGLSTRYPVAFIESMWIVDLVTGEEELPPNYPPGWLQRNVIEKSKALFDRRLFANAQLNAIGRLRRLGIIPDSKKLFLERIEYLLRRMRAERD